MTTTAVFDDADAYEIQMGRWSRRLAEPFLDFIGERSDSTVLDVGCGTGNLTAALLRRWPRCTVHGIDSAEPYVTRAREALGEKAELRVGDARTLPWPDRSHDAVLALLVLHFLPDADAAIREMRRIAKPGATVAAAVWDSRGGFVAQRMFYDTAAALDQGAIEARARHLTRPLCRPGELEAAWRRAGFRDVAGTSLVIRMEFAAFDDYWKPFAAGQGGLAGYLATLNDETRAILRDLMRAAYLDGEADGPRSYAALAFAVRGIAPP